MTDPDLSWLRAMRAEDPDAIVRAAATRTRRALLPADGKLMLIAADHTARGMIGVRSEPTAMADRGEMLRRIVVALSRPGVDGVLGTADVLEDLLLLGALENKVVVGSMNRGGLQGATFELDDRFTGCDASSLASMRFDGGKMLTRIDISDAGTVATLESCARAINELADHGLMAMVEPFISGRVDGRLRHDLSTIGVIRSVAIASGLGRTSRHTWMKLPVVEEMERVMEATTMPTLLLGGDPSTEPHETYASWQRALGATGVRGLIVGRALLYPPGDDVAAAVDVATKLVHG
jgi:hypothetical protein